MALVNRNRISLYQEARDGLISLFQQTSQVFIGLLLLIVLTGGNPPGFLVGFSFIAGIMFVALKEDKRLKRFIAKKSSEILQQEDDTYQSPTAIQLNASEQTLVNLSQWLQGTVDAAGWETVDVLQTLFGTKLAIVRSDIKRGKLINLETYTGSQAVILLVGLTREANQTVNVLLQVYPNGGQAYLPQGLKLTVLEASGEPAIDVEGKSIEAEAKTNSYYIQRQLTATYGENFSIRITL
jgi:hypothetical protein